jgi:hypothetical protein
MTTFEIAFHERIAQLRAYSPDDFRSVLKAPEALLLPLIGSTGITVSSADIDTELACVSPRPGAQSRS